MTTQEISQFVKRRVDPTDADRARANERDRESKLDQIIANALQQKRYLCKNGFIERVDVGEFSITANSKAELTTERAKMLEMAALAEQLGIDVGDR